MVNLDGKSIIVSGGGSGIGRSAALIMAQAGARLVVADISDSGGQETVALIRDAGGEAAFVRTDVTVSTDAEHLVRIAVDTYGKLNGAFNNAGVPPAFGPFMELGFEAWERALRVNLTGVFLCMRFEIAAMLEAGGGAIVNTSSVAGISGQAFCADYCASKHGVLGLTKATALEFAKRNIRINAILPGATDTPMRRNALRLSPDGGEARAKQLPMGRVSTADEVAEAAMWLLSDSASYVTGLCMSVDGGVTAGYL
jgi:NAD(P)-dependent dehydrogenase (short-subunit alcohol dehydrogenase family)